MKKIAIAVLGVIFVSALISFTTTHKKSAIKVEVQKTTDGHYVFEPNSQF